MFRGPLLHLGTGLFARQLALEHLGTHRLALDAELFGEGLLLRRRVGEEPSAITCGEAGTCTGANTSTLPDRKALARTGTDSSTLAGGKALACTGTDSGTLAGGKALACTGTDALTRTGGKSATLTDERSALPHDATALADALHHAHAASTLTGEPTHLLPLLNALRLTTGEVVYAGERPGLQATLREGRYCDRGERHGETKELDGAHLRLPMSVGD
jgi:hypothetical protein